MMKPRSVAVLVVLSLCFLVGCGASPATTTSHATPTAVPATTTPATVVPSSTSTTDRDPFQVNFLQHYQLITCPTEPNPTNLCYTLQDDPSASTLGKVSFAGTDILYMLPQDASCGPAERNGALKVANGGTINVHAMGTYCVPGYPVQFTFTVTGGTGKYQQASGGGTIDVGPAGIALPPPTSFGAEPFARPDVFSVRNGSNQGRTGDHTSCSPPGEKCFAQPTSKRYNVSITYIQGIHHERKERFLSGSVFSPIKCSAARKCPHHLYN